MTSALSTVPGTEATAPLSVPSATLPLPRPYLTPVPACEPPFDDELPRRARRAVGRPAVQPRAVQPRKDIGAPVADWSVPGWSNEPDIGVAKTPSTALPSPRDTAVVLARALIEVVAGRRSLTQLATHCSPEVFAGLQRTSLQHAGPLPKLMSVRTCQPADGVTEASAVFRRGHRAAALAFRLQGIDGRWRLTALQIG